MSVPRAEILGPSCDLDEIPFLKVLVTPGVDVTVVVSKYNSQGSLRPLDTLVMERRVPRRMKSNPWLTCPHRGLTIERRRPVKMLHVYVVEWALLLAFNSLSHSIRESLLTAVDAEESGGGRYHTEQHVPRVAGLQRPHPLAFISSRWYFESFISLCSCESWGSGQR